MPTKRNSKHLITRKVYKKRSNNAEHPFETFKYLMKQVPLLLIGIEKRLSQKTNIRSFLSLPKGDSANYERSEESIS